KDSGTILLGFATLMFGLETMSAAVSSIKDVPAFSNLIVKFQNPFLGLLVGAVLTALIQSSSATVGILQSFSLSGMVTYSAAIPMIMGMNIGACVPTLISSIGTNKNAKRAAMYHLVFNVLGALFWLLVFIAGQNIIDRTILLKAVNPFRIAVVHSTFKIMCVLLLAPFNKYLERLVCRLVPDSASPEKKVELDERLLKAPALALERCRILMDDMAKVSMESISMSLSSLGDYTDDIAREIQEKEDLTDHYEDVMGTYLVKLSATKIGNDESIMAAEYLKLISDFERISDHSVDVMKSSREMKDKGIDFTDEADSELSVMIDAIKEITNLAYTAFVKGDLNAAFKVEPLEQVVDYLKEEIRTRHIKRLQKGNCSIEAGFVLNDLLTSMQRVSDHCSNIAGCVIDADMNNLNLHQTLKDYKHNSQKFNKVFEAFKKQYALPSD
ncbi:MAG: Na/Pi cotransporter family protein, partial [Spirochaetales bacterium]